MVLRKREMHCVAAFCRREHNKNRHNDIALGRRYKNGKCLRVTRLSIVERMELGEGLIRRSVPKLAFHLHLLRKRRHVTYLCRETT